MPVVVIGLNHRTAPLELLERTTVAPDALAQGARTTSARGRTSTRPWCSSPATAPRSTPSSSGSTAPTRTSATSCAISRPAAPEDLADHLYSQFDDDAVAPPLRGRLRARLGRARRVRDPRPGPHALGAGPHRGCRPGRAQPAVPPRPRGRQAGAHRDGHRPLAPPRCRHAAVAMATDRLGTLPGRRVLVVGAGDMGEGMAVALRRRRRRRDARGQPHGPAGRRGRLPGRRAWPSGLARGRRARWSTPTCCSPRPAPARCCSSTTPSPG